jgi:hypothetical protein
MPFVFNLQTVSTVHRSCHSFLSRHDVVGCEQEVIDLVKKITSAPETKKKK